MDLKKYSTWACIPILWVIEYLLISFIQGDINSMSWGTASRILFLAVALLTTLITATYTSEQSK